MMVQNPMPHSSDILHGTEKFPSHNYIYDGTGNYSLRYLPACGPISFAL
jgi:hypothetical protein